MSFDYEAAWEKRVLPEILSVPQNIRELFIRVADEAKEISQHSDLSLPWASPALRVAFSKVPAEELSWATALFYYFGHWASKDWSYASRWGWGAYWKFAKYADASLDARLELPSSHDGLLCTTKVHSLNGQLRVNVSDRHGWSNHDVGLTGAGSLARLMATVERLREAPSGFHLWDSAMRGLRRDELRRSERYRAIADLSEFGIPEDET